MKILFITNLYPPNIVGGYEKLCFDVVSGFVARGHQTIVLTSDYGGKVEDFPGQKVERSLKLFATEGNIYQPFERTPEERAAMNAHNSEMLRKIVERDQPQVIFLWNLFFLDPSLVETIERLRLPIAYLLTDNWFIIFLNAAFMQDYFAQRVFSDQPAPSYYLSMKRWVKRQRNQSFHIRGHAIFASRFMRDLYTEAGFRFEHNTVIYHGVNLSEHSPADFVDRRRLIQQGELGLLVAGRIVEIKGVHTAIAALLPISHMLPNMKVRLTVLGNDQDRPYMQKLSSQIAQLGVTNMIDFAMPVAESELFKLFQSYDIYLFPSLYEPFSLTLIHALNAGIPTVASNAGGNPEIVHHMQTGMLFPKSHSQELAKAVVKLALDDSLRQAVSENAQNVTYRYTFGHMLGEVEHLLEKML
jgi:glycogen(starch) synthase